MATLFTSTNMIALTVPAGDYEKEAALLTELESMEEIDYSMGLANVEAMNGYMLADKLMPWQFSELPISTMKWRRCSMPPTPQRAGRLRQAYGKYQLLQGAAH